MENPGDAFRVQNYYQIFSHSSVPAVFAMLQEQEITALANGETTGTAVSAAVARIREGMKRFPGKCFVSTDFCSPTDSPRYLSSKRGSVASAESAWFSLVTSPKTREMAGRGMVRCVCVRPFRVFDVPREFRLFVKNGEAAAMSQRFLVRHFRRLVKRTDEYWEIACSFLSTVRGQLPAGDLALDFYITSRKKVIVIDINPWGPPTDPLMLGTWDRDVSSPLGCLIVPPPHTISGDVNVSF